MPSPTNDWTPPGTPIGKLYFAEAMGIGPLHNLLSDAAADIATEHGDDGAAHYMHNRGAWRPISRCSYDDLLEDGVNVRLMRVEW